MEIFIGLDIGGTKLMAAAANRDGEILRKTREETSESFEKDLDVLNKMIASVAKDDQIQGMGAAIGGPLDWEKGIVSPLHQPDWRDIPLKDIMEKQWGCPFFVDVDTNIAALGEYYATQIVAKRFLYITLSTGMGGGFLIDGKIYRGAYGSHPEVGHQSIPYRCMNSTAIQCECGAPDCLEALVSGNGIRRIYGKPAENLNSNEWDEVAYNLGQGLRNAAALYTPELIRVGGGVAIGRGEAFIERATSVMRSHLYIIPAPVVELSHLGYETALIGATSVAIHGLFE